MNTLRIFLSLLAIAYGALEGQQPSGTPQDSLCATQFTIKWPVGFALRSQGGTDSCVRLWSRGADSISADWGPSQFVASVPIEQPDSTTEWAVVDTILGGAQVQVATYRCGPEITRWRRSGPISGYMVGGPYGSRPFYGSARSHAQRRTAKLFGQAFQQLRSDDLAA